MEVKPGYKQTEVGVIPEDWEVTTAAAVCDLVVDCKNRTPPVVDGGDYAVARTPNVRNGKFVREELRFTDDQSFREWTARAIPQIGDILITREAPLGEVCLVPSDVRVCLGQRMMLYRTDQETADCRFLLYALMSSGVQRNLLRKIGGSTVGHAKVDDIRNLQIPLPPTKAEQEAIAEALSDADAFIESLEQLLTKKRQIKKGAMQELLTGKKRLPGFSGEWEVKRLGMLAMLSKSSVNPASSPDAMFTHFSLPAFDAGAVPVVEEGGRIGSNKFLVPDNAVLLSKLNPRIPRIWLPSHIPNNAVCSTEFLVLVPNEATDRNYLAALCSSPAVCYLMELHAIGTTGSHQRIHPLQALAIEVNTPRDKAEQTAIATILSDMDAEITALEFRLAKARQIKQGMMQELLTGRIRLI